MSTQQICNGLVLIAIATSLLFSASSWGANININFTGVISPGTCDIDVDPPSLNLGNVDMLALQAGDAMENADTFNLNVKNCALAVPTTLRPAVQIDGEGFDAGGTFLFRGSDSTSHGIGVIVLDGAGSALKAGDYLDFGNVGGLPNATMATYIVAVSCGPAAACATNNTAPGGLVARIMFNFRYY
ncbi:MAG: fimbrial protein [Kluyvera sp.]|uniref:fimbrial protein n=1 Tax=Kluyvera sp. TaxID=1538228 RepID=UPI003F36F483